LRGLFIEAILLVMQSGAKHNQQNGITKQLHGKDASAPRTADKQDRLGLFRWLLPQGQLVNHKAAV
jgi:hypothetical protein